MNRAFLDYYRCPEELVGFEPTAPLAGPAGYFRFGGEICFGRARAGATRTDPAQELTELIDECAPSDGGWLLPFDPDTAADALRNERYVLSGLGKEGWVGRTVRGAYYLLRPLLSVSIRRQLQRRALGDWRRISFPRWPLDTTVEAMMKRLASLTIRDQDRAELPFVWFWPQGKRGCMIMTHDVETEVGRDYCDSLMDIDEAHGLKAAFQLVPEVRYSVPQSLLKRMRDRGFEANVHGLSHDGRLFQDRTEFLRRAKRINDYAAQWGSVGFRSPVLYRNQDWFDALAFEYDMSVPNLGHLEGQRGGCCTVMPYFIGDLVELPLTTTQDYSILHILEQPSLDLWRTQVEAVLREHGLISFIVHPDYVRDEPGRSLFASLCGYLKEFCQREGIWIASPAEVARWWRQRNAAQIVRDGNGWKLSADSVKDARIARATVEGQSTRYAVDDGKP